jgi:uncharacterized iron-regulated protein
MRTLFWILMLLSVMVLTGCASDGFFSSREYERSQQDWAHDPYLLDAPPHGRPMVIARGEQAGTRLHWPQLKDAIQWADIVLLGERHNDQVGHDTKRAILALWDGHGVLAMEMLTRDQQMYVDDWVADIGVRGSRTADDILVDRTTLWPNHDEAYAPLMHVAKEKGWPIVASNAPRQYVRMARTDGFTAMRRLTPEQQRMFVIPKVMPIGPYRDRFMESMGGMAGHMDVESFFRSQTVWDATMADSIIRAREAHPGATVFHVNGAFHSDFDGGIVVMLLRANPDLRILNISLVPGDGPELLPEDADRADLVIYTGAPPEDDDATM